MAVIAFFIQSHDYVSDMRITPHTTNTTLTSGIEIWRIRVLKMSAAELLILLMRTLVAGEWRFVILV